VLPEPVAEPEPPRAAVVTATVAPTGELRLDAVLDAWPAVVDVIREANAMVSSALADARPVAVSEREMTIAFPPGAAFLRRLAEQDDHRRIATEAVRTVLGAALALRFELRDVEDQAAEPEVATTLAGEELVKRFLEEFNAEELLDDEPDEREAH
jgi:hypothetical protein